MILVIANIETIAFKVATFCSLSLYFALSNREGGGQDYKLVLAMNYFLNSFTRENAELLKHNKMDEWF